MVQSAPSPAAIRLRKLLTPAALWKLWRMGWHLPLSLGGMLRASLWCTIRRKPATVVVLINQLGDIVAAEPAARLAAERSGNQLYWVVARQFAPIVSTLPYVKKTIPVLCASEWIIMRHLYQILPYLNQTIFHIDQHPCNWFGLPVNNRTIHDINMSNYYYKGGLLPSFSLQGLGVALDQRPHWPRFDRELEEFLRNDAEILELLKSPFAVVHFSSNEVERSASRAQAMACMNWLLNAGFSVIELGYQPVLASCHRVKHLSPDTPLALQFTLIAKSSAFIGVDSAFAHVANTYAIPSAILIGKYAHYTEHIPYSGTWRVQDGCRIIRSRDEVKCLPIEKIIAELEQALPRAIQ